MSRIGNLPILIPKEVTVEKTGSEVMVTGPKGSLKLKVEPETEVTIGEGKVVVKRQNDETRSRALHGLTRNLVANMIVGVLSGWSKNLELHGVGFRASGGGNQITLNVGYSHPVTVQAPQGITFEVVDNTKIKVSGIDKYLVGQVAANLKSVRRPDAYKGKGIRYEGEYIRKKAGKSGKVGAAGGAK